MIYLDNSATTRPNEACVAAMNELLTECWFNPSSVYRPGMDAAHRLEGRHRRLRLRPCRCIPVCRHVRRAFARRVQRVRRIRLLHRFVRRVAHHRVHTRDLLARAAQQLLQREIVKLFFRMFVFFRFTASGSPPTAAAITG